MASSVIWMVVLISFMPKVGGFVKYWVIDLSGNGQKVVDFLMTLVQLSFVWALLSWSLSDFLVSAELMILSIS